MISHNLQQRGAAEAGDVKFAVEQRMVFCSDATARGAQLAAGAKACCLATNFTQNIELDTAVAIPRDFACDVREKVLSNKYPFVVLFGTVWGSVHLLCHGDVSQDDLWSMLEEMEDVVINLRRRHHTPSICDWI